MRRDQCLSQGTASEQPYRHRACSPNEAPFELLERSYFPTPVGTKEESSSKSGGFLSPSQPDHHDMDYQRRRGCTFFGNQLFSGLHARSRSGQDRDGVRVGVWRWNIQQGLRARNRQGQPETIAMGHGSGWIGDHVMNECS